MTLSPGEERFLRGFVRRHALRWPVGLFALATAVWALAGLSERERSSPRPATPPATLAESSLRSELESLRQEIEGATASGTDPSEALLERVGILSARIDAVGRDLAELRADIAVAVAAGVPPEFTPMLERVYNLERRQEQLESAMASGGRSARDRLEALEERQQRRERQEMADAEAVRERLYKLETARDAAENRRLEAQTALSQRISALEAASGAAAPAP